MDKKELNKILENHKHWLRRDCDGWENMKADLKYADLTGVDLSGVDLECVDFTGTKLYGANLSHTNLRYTNFYGSNLYWANLRYADLKYANLHEAILTEADLYGSKNVPFIPYSCPEFGSFIGYKKARGYIVELEILADAKRLSATSRKCRCDKAKVLRILNYDHTEADVLEVASNRDDNFIYRVGKIVSVKNFDEYRWNKCSAGIHFFINFQEAVNYYDYHIINNIGENGI